MLAITGLACGAGGFWWGVSGGDADRAAAPGGGLPSGEKLAELRATAIAGDSAMEGAPPAVKEIVDLGVGALESGDFRNAFAVLSMIADAGERQHALLELIGRIDAQQMGQLFELIVVGQADELGVGFGEEFGMITMFAMVDRWVELDVDAAADFALRAVEGNVPEGIIPILVAAFVAQRDIPRARQLFHEMKGARPELEDDFDAVIYIGAAFDDPLEAMRLYREDGGTGEEDIDPLFEIAGPRVGELLGEVMAMPKSENRAGLIEELFEGWAKVDPEAALAQAATLDEGDGRDEVIRDVMRRFAVRDPLGALASLHLVREEHRDRVQRSIVETWAGRDTSAALGWARDNLEPAALGALLVAVEENVEPALAVELVAGLGEKERQLFFKGSSFTDAGHFLQRWAHTDAAAAVAWLNDNGLLEKEASPEAEAASAPSRMMTISEDRSTGHRIAQAALQQGVDDAQALFATLPEGEFREGFLGGLASEFGRNDPAAAADWAASLAPEESAEAMAGIAAGWASADPVAASEWAMGSGSEGAFDAALSSWSRGDPEAAYRWLVGELGEEPERVASTAQSSGLLNDWAVRDPQAAAEATLGFPEDLAPAQMSTVAGRWAAFEPMAASAFIGERLEPGPVRDAAIGALVEQIKDDDLPSAVAWAREVSDEAARYALLDSLATE